MSMIVSEFGRSLNYATEASKVEVRIDLRIANYAILLFASLGVLSGLITLKSLADYGLNSFDNYITGAIFSGGEDDYSVNELAKSATKLAHTTELLQLASLVSAVSFGMCGVCVAYRRYMHPEFYN